MSTLTEAEKRERQQKAMGAAFLAHQVDKLEKSVDNLSFDRSQALYNPNGPRARGGAQAGRSQVQHDRTLPKPGPKPVYILDASILVHGLPLVKLWVRQDQYKLIVPLAVISTLDRLKLAPNPLHDLAREATRFLDGQFQIARQIAAAAPPGADPPGIRLRPQREGEELSWADTQARFTVPETFEAEYPAELVEVFAGKAEKALANGEEPELLPGAEADRIPKELRPTLQCALHFHFNNATNTNAASTAKSPLGPASLVVYPALPTPPTPSALLFPPTSTSTDFLALSSGDAIATLLDTFFFPSHVELYRVSAAEVDAARDWFRAQARAAQAGRDKAPAVKQEAAPQTSSRPRRAGREQERPEVGEGAKRGGRGQGKGRGGGEGKLGAGAGGASGGGNGGGSGGGRRGHGANERGSAPAAPPRTNSNNSRPATGVLFVP